MDPTPLITRLLDRIPQVWAIYGFGSRVTGGADASSDLDLAILTPTRIDPLTLWELSGELAILAGCPVDLLDLRAASTVMQYQVITTGRPFRTLNTTQTALFECFVCSEKTDLDEARRPLIQQIQREGRIHAR
ncbi:MAG: nucleotidyltransferase domain-containing protein [Magnetococcales bacterium]|nr:nucleotidyltransferase domain-containing protein [Magnetococcales bacterium]